MTWKRWCWYWPWWSGSPEILKSAGFICQLRQRLVRFSVFPTPVSRHSLKISSIVSMQLMTLKYHIISCNARNSRRCLKCYICGPSGCHWRQTEVKWPKYVGNSAVLILINNTIDNIQISIWWEILAPSPTHTHWLSSMSNPFLGNYFINGGEVWRISYFYVVEIFSNALAPGQGMCYVDHTRDGRCSRQTKEMIFFYFILMFEKL